MATERSEGQSLYGVLGLEPRASREQVERAYRFHLELYGEASLASAALLDPAEAEHQRRRVREAYEVLSDPERRRAYDESQGFGPPHAPVPPQPSPVPGPPAEAAPAPGNDDVPVAFAEPTPVSASPEEPRVAALLSPASAAFESFRVLRTKVHGLDADRPARCLGLVSATAQEGTSVVAAGLAAALAQESGRRVLLLEARLRAPALERVLGLVAGPGLGEWLDGGTGQPLPLRRVEPWNFHLLAAGAPLPRATELPGSGPFLRLLSAARASYDFVLLDCPPLEAAADAAVLQRALDGFLLVVRVRHASRQAIRQAIARLEPGAVRGVVFNDRTEILARWLDRRRPRPAP